MQVLESLKQAADSFFEFDIGTPKRVQTHVSARNTSAKYCYSKGYSLKSIGRILNRNHSSIIHSIYVSNVPDYFVDTKHILFEKLDQIIYTSTDKT